MSGFADEAKAIESRMQANWSTTPVKYEGVPFAAVVTPYVALFVRDGEGQQISLGTVALRRWVGVIIIQVFVPEDTGTRQARIYADGVGAIFDRAQFSVDNSGTIRCRIPSVEMIGVRDGWLQINVTIPFIRDRQY